MKHLILFLLLAVGLQAQVSGPVTRVDPNQLPTSTTQGVWMNIPGIGAVLVQLDPASIKLDLTTNPPTLKAITTTATIPPVNRDVIIPPPNTQNVTISKATYVLATLHVYKNGLLQYQGGDYTVSGTTVSFIIPTSTPTDVIQLEYQF